MRIMMNSFQCTSMVSFVCCNAWEWPIHTVTALYLVVLALVDLRSCLPAFWNSSRMLMFKWWYVSLAPCLSIDRVSFGLVGECWMSFSSSWDACYLLLVRYRCHKNLIFSTLRVSSQDVLRCTVPEWVCTVLVLLSTAPGRWREKFWLIWHCNWDADQIFTWLTHSTTELVQFNVMWCLPFYLQWRWKWKK